MEATIVQDVIYYAELELVCVTTVEINVGKLFYLCVFAHNSYAAGKK